MSELNTSELLRFKFRWLSANGNPEGFVTKKGHFDGQTLVLDDVELPAGLILQLQTHEDRVFLTFPTAKGEIGQLAFVISGNLPTKLKQAIDASRSHVWARNHREQLRKAGQEHTYREEVCRHCHATLILSDMALTPQVYCHFCDTLTTIKGQAPAGERDLQLCGECGMFSRPRRFTVFYFYFLVVLYGWHSRPTWRCPACMRRDAWKMLFGNLPFVLGVPVALVQLRRCYGGGDSGPFAGLDTANLKARSGNVREALAGYAAIGQRVPHSAGLKYNLGLALLQQDDAAQASKIFEAALNDCSNYAPAYQQLVECYQRLGEHEKLAELKYIWGESEDDNVSTAQIVE